MKKLILLLLVLIAVNQVNAQKLKIKGSDTVLPLTQKEAEDYMKKNAGASIMVTGGGSGVGIAALLNGTTDIAQSSRSLKLDEKIKLQDAGKAFKETIIAFDALAVIVNPANNVSQLTREQLEGIFTGKITNWKEVGGADLKMVVYSRETSSGTYEFFKEHVLKGKNFSPSALLMPATGAIGYVGLAYLEKEVKALKVSFDRGKTFVGPAVETAKNKTYPITRPLYYYYLKTSEAMVSPYVNFVLSAAGQKLVLATGYVPLK
jgi:phosphate transport system substrate-binding protein